MENPEENRLDAADSTSNAVYEYAIGSDTRSFLKGLEQKETRPSSKLFYITGIAASLLVLVAAVFTINMSHGDSAIAKEYGINRLVSRSSENISNDKFTEAVRSYYEKDYDKASAELTKVDLSAGKVSDYVDWLTILIELQTNGSESPVFKTTLDRVLSNENHEFYSQANKMQADLKLFWRSMVF